MAHQNPTFDSFHSFNNAHPSFILSNPNAYNNYAGNLSPQYSSRSSSSHNSWGSSVSQPTYHPAAHSQFVNLPHNSQTSGYVNSGYSSYPPSSPSSQLSERKTHPAYQGSHHSLNLNHRHRTDDSTAYPMLLSGLGDVSNLHPPRSASISGGNIHAWSNSRTNNPLQGLDAGITSDALGWSPHSVESQLLGFDSWSDSSASSPDIGMSVSQEYNYSLEISSVPPPQPRSATILPLRHVSPTSTRSSSSPESCGTSIESSTSTRKSCSHCHATSTPLWRREPNTLKPLCNACGLYLQQRNKHRPQELIDADAADDSDVSDGDGSGPECSHCHTHHTSVWRRSKTGAQLCNACGVYSRLRGKDRPLSLKRNKIKPRSKHTPPISTSPL